MPAGVLALGRALKLRSLLVHNLRAIRQVEIDGLKDSVVLVGENGSGKTTLLDAVRLLKSLSGEYSQNETAQVLGEFQITTNQGQQPNLGALHGDPSKPVHIEGEFELAEEEKSLLAANSEAVVAGVVTSENEVPAMPVPAGRSSATAAGIRRARERVQQLGPEYRGMLTEDLKAKTLRASLTLNVDQRAPIVDRGVALAAMFTTWRPSELGTIIYHPAHRTFSRDAAGAINLSQRVGEQLRQHAMTANSAKYSGLKTELVSIRARELLTERSSDAIPAQRASEIEATIQRLFQTFFPSKRFRGISFDQEGRPRVDVELADGRCHDIDDLSSGEREALFGYLRLYSSRARHSILLLDEPELHMHPRMSGELIRFLKDTIGLPRGNQVIAASHSELILTSAFKDRDASVFFVRRELQQGAKDGSQATRVESETDTKIILDDLLGHLTRLVQGNPIVFFEGENSEFDLWMTTELFPELQSCTAISGGSKQRVQKIRTAVESALSKIGAHIPVFAICDGDFDERIEDSTNLQWDAYHIENYLLDDELILDQARRTLGSKNTLKSSEEVGAILKECATAQLEALSQADTQRDVNKALRLAMTIKPGSADELADRLSALTDSLVELRKSQLSLTMLKRTERQAVLRLEAALKSDEWRTRLPGRTVLQMFCERVFGKQLKYETFRNQLVCALKDRPSRPIGMVRVLGRVLRARSS